MIRRHAQQKTFLAQLAFALLVVLLASFSMSSVSYAQFNPMMNYQGKLTDDSGMAVTDGTYEIEFSLYTQAAGGVPVWTETLSGANEVLVTNGLFSVMLGSTTPLSNVDFDQTLYLGVTVEADAEMTPRKILGTVPAAFEAEHAGDSDTVGGVASSSFLRSDQADTATGLLTFTGGFISQASSTITGLTTQTATTTYLVINGERFNDLTGTGLSNNSGVLTVDTSMLDTRYASTTDFDTYAELNAIVADVTLTHNGLIDTSSELLALVVDETGTGRLVFSNAPAFSGTATFSALTATSTLTLSGTAANIALGSNFLSGDGDDEGISIHANGNVGIGTTSASVKLSVAGGALLSYDPGPTFSVSLGLENLNGRQYDLLSSGTDHATNPNGFAIFDRTNAEYRLLINSSGNIGIGTTTPSSLLTVDGNINTTGNLSFDESDASSGLYFPEDNYFARGSWNDTADQTGILIPLYIYPSSVFTNDDYNEVIELKNRYKNVPLYVILNPGSGPGTVTDGNYTAAIQRLHGAGAIVLGYIATQYMASSTGEMASQIDDWLTYYPEIDGIFMDEMTNTTASNEIEHYETITRYAHGRGLYPVIGNPGSGVGGVYFASPTADIIVTVESGTYPSEADLKGDYDDGYADYTYKKRASLLYGQSDFNTSNVSLLKKYTGLVYVTDDALSPNPWDSVSSHLETLFEFLSSENRRIFTDLYVDGNLGVGTTTPTHALSVIGNALITGTTTFDGNISITGSIIPTADITYDLGSPDYQWRDVYIGPGSLYINGKKVIEDISNTITISTDNDQNLMTETTGIGNVTMRATGSGNAAVLSGSGNININSTSGNVNLGTTGSGQLNLGTVDSGIWQGTAVADDYGGTGQTTYAAGDMLYASGVNTLAKRSIGSTGSVLSVVGGVPTWVATSTLGISSSVVAAGSSGELQFNAGGNFGAISTLRYATSSRELTIGDSSGATLHFGNSASISSGIDSLSFSAPGGFSADAGSEGFTFDTTATGNDGFNFNGSSDTPFNITGNSLNVSTVFGELVFDWQGNLGIGTTTPNSRLSIQGADANGNGDAPSALSVYGGQGDQGDPGGKGGYIELYGGTGGTLLGEGPGMPGDGGDIYIAGGALGYGGPSSDGNVLLGITRNGDARGRVGIGTLTPTHELSVEGNALISGNLQLGTDLAVSYGGTGASTLTDGGILLGSGTGAITAMGVLSNGAIVVGDGTTDPVALNAFTSSTGYLTHERGGLEADVSAITTGGMFYGTGAGTVGIRTIGSTGSVLSVVGGLPTWVATSTLGIGASPAGLDTQLQFNNGGAFGALNTLTFSSSTRNLHIGNGSGGGVTFGNGVAGLSVNGSDDITLSGANDLVLSGTGMQFYSNGSGEGFTFTGYSSEDQFTVETNGGFVFESGLGPDPLGKFVMDSFGNVGIGTTTSETALTVMGTTTNYGNLRFGSSSGATESFLIAPNDMSASYEQGHDLTVRAGYSEYDGGGALTLSGGSCFSSCDGGPVYITGGSADSGAAGGVFINGGTIVGGNAHVYLASSGGAVNIGAGVPSQNLDINGTNAEVLLEESTTEFTRLGVGETPNTSILGWDDADSMIFGLYSSPTDTTIDAKMTILADGSVGIGTTTPSQTLTVAGTSNFTGNLTLSGSAANIALGSNWLSGDGGDEGIFIDGGGNVGIGTTTIGGNTLAVDGIVQSSNGYIVGDGGASGAALSATILAISDFSMGQMLALTRGYDYGYGTTSSLLLSSGSFNIAIPDGSSPRFSITETGNVGIGTTTPSATLSVAGGLLVTGISSLNETNFNNSALTGIDTLTIADIGQGEGLCFESGCDTGISVYTTAQGGYDALTFDADAGFDFVFNTGNVGIGTSTPTSKLTIQGDDSVSGDAPVALSVLGGRGRTAIVGGTGGAISLIGGMGGQGTGGGEPIGGAGGSVTITGGSGGPGGYGSGTGGNVYIAGGESGTGIGWPDNVGHVVLAHNGSVATGKVGIGDTTPSQKLDIDGTNAQILIEESTTEFTRLGVGETTNTSILGWDDADSMVFGLYSGPADTTIDAKMTILANGNLGIGTSTPTSKLTVAGTSNFTGNLTLSGSAANIALGSNWLSGDGGEEGVSVTGDGDIIFLGASGDELYLDLNEGSGYPTFYSSADVVSFASHTEILDGFELTLSDVGNDRSAYLFVEDNGPTVFGTSAGDLALLPAGNVGIGTSTPSQLFTVAGNARITGALYDSTNSAGTAGHVLQSTGTGQRWVATSSLGFSAGLATTDIDTSTELRAIVSDTTGTGALVFGTSPTFTTQITSPLVVGGTATNQDLTFKTTSGVGATGADMHFLVGNNGATEAMTILNNGSVGIGNTSGALTAVLTVGETIQFLGSSTTVTLGIGDNNTGFFRPNWNMLAIATNGEEAMRITDSGSVSIGTQSSPAMLTVQSEGINDIFNLRETGGSEVFTVLESGNVGIGTTSPISLLAMSKTSGLTGSVTAGIEQYFTFANASPSAVYYGDNTYINNNPTATSTLVGKMLRINDSTVLGNTVRGLEVQAHRGTNTQGENTALSGFARTFGVRGTTEGDAGGVFEPAGVFGETKGTTQGNAIRGYSGSITTSDLLSLFQDTSAFAGTGLLMNFGNSGGSFSSTTSKFVDFQTAGTSKFTVGAHGMTTIGDGTTSNNAGLQIGYGGLCVDNDGTCTASTTGRITSVSSAVGNSDLAEMYFGDDDLEPGDIIATAGILSIEKADTENARNIIGVVSTKPGLTLGFDDSSLTSGQTGYPVALSGRVPIKLSTENGPIKKGDKIMLSSIPGVGMKAISGGVVVGTALEDFDGEYAYSEGFVDQFGDDIAQSNTVPLNTETDERIHDGCSFGAGGALGEDDEECTPRDTDRFTTIESAVSDRNEEMREALMELAEMDAAVLETADGEDVYVGQALMFVNLGWHQSVHEQTVLAELTSTSTDLVLGSEDGEETLWDRLKTLAQGFVDGILSIAGLRAENVYVENELCVDGVCVTADDLRALLDEANRPTNGSGSGEQPMPLEEATPPPPEEPVEEDPEEPQEPIDEEELEQQGEAPPEEEVETEEGQETGGEEPEMHEEEEELEPQTEEPSI